MSLPLTRRAYQVTVILAFVILFSLGALYTKLLSSNVTATWSYDYERDPACSSALTSNCVDHFEVLDITNQQRFSMIQSVPNPPSPRGKLEHLSVSFKYGPPFGQRTISVVAVGRDRTGARVTSNPFAARATVKIQPISKAGISFLIISKDS